MRKWWVGTFQQIVEFITNFWSITKGAKPPSAAFVTFQTRPPYGGGSLCCRLREAVVYNSSRSCVGNTKQFTEARCRCRLQSLFFIVLFAVPGPHRDSRLRVGCTPFGIWNKYILEIAGKKSARGISVLRVFFFYSPSVHESLSYSWYLLFAACSGCIRVRTRLSSSKIPWLFPWPFQVFHNLRFSCHFRKFSKLSLF